MDMLEAHARLCCVDEADRGELLEDGYYIQRHGQTFDLWPAAGVGFASLSGWLEDAGDDAELAEAIRHGKALVDGGVRSIDDLNREARIVVDAVLEWGKEQERCSGG